jgi:hypothetical protein
MSTAEIGKFQVSILKEFPDNFDEGSWKRRATVSSYKLQQLFWDSFCSNLLEVL